MNKFANNKGITLAALVVTIILLLVLAGVGVIAGKNSIESARLAAYGTELQTIQNKVNELEQKYRNGDESVLSLGNTLQGTPQENTALSEAGVGTSADVKARYRYYTKDTLTSLNLPNFNQEFLVDVANRSVISLYGIKYKKDENGNDKYIWTVEQLEDKMYNIDYGGIQSIVTFSLSSGNKKIYVDNIQYTGNVKKGTIYYGQGASVDEVNWKIAKNDTTDKSCTIEVYNEGTWYVKIIDSAGNESDKKPIEVKQ